MNRIQFARHVATLPVLGTVNMDQEAIQPLWAIPGMELNMRAAVVLSTLGRVGMDAMKTAVAPGQEDELEMGTDELVLEYLATLSYEQVAELGIYEMTVKTDTSKFARNFYLQLGDSLLIHCTLPFVNDGEVSTEELWQWPGHCDHFFLFSLLDSGVPQLMVDGPVGAALAQEIYQMGEALHVRGADKARHVIEGFVARRGKAIADVVSIAWQNEEAE